MRPAARDALLLLMLTGGAVLLHGYHVGVQDQEIYLPAVKKLLHPSLYPHDSEFFLSQTRWMLFDEMVAGAARVTGSLQWVLLAGQLLTVFLVLLGCLRLARVCFAEPAAQWAGVALVTAMLALPATGTLIPLVDNYLHPRGIATAAILLAWPTALAGRWWWLLSVVVAAPFHPMMALIGGFHLAVQRWRPPRHARALTFLPWFALASPIVAGDDAWRVLLEGRRHFFPLRWTWYEWIGVVVPLAFLWWMSRRQAKAAPFREHVAARLLVSTGVGIAAAVVVTSVPALERLIVTQPMRVLHLAYIAFFLFLGGWLGQIWLRMHPIRWATVFVPVCAVMFYVQTGTFEGSGHLDWPGNAPRNPWVQAFVWARENTAVDAKFLLPFDYMRRPGEDFYGFRAWAERSRTVDDVKDRAVAALNPSLAMPWTLASELPRAWELAREGLRPVRKEEWSGVREEWKVTWILDERGVLVRIAPELSCPYANDVVMVCRIPEPVNPPDTIR
jgi:hypothetical protein